jgi:NADP-dependent 3-hydroxy acid dehydrogenase YdfG
MAPRKRRHSRSGPTPRSGSAPGSTSGADGTLVASAGHVNTEVVVVTGASAGIGRAIVQALAREGARIGLIARDISRLESAQQEVERLGGEALVLPLDVADYPALKRAAGLVEEKFGAIDIWINNAMTSVFSPVQRMTPEEYRRVTDVTYLGYVYGTLIALESMTPRNHGVIIQVGSALAYRSIPLQSAYCAAKHAVKGFTMSLRSELIYDESRVRVTMVQLPAINTPQFDWARNRLPKRLQPLPPIFQPEVAVRAIMYAMRHDVGRELLVGWPAIKASLAERVAANFADRKLAKDGYPGQQSVLPNTQSDGGNLMQPVPGDQAAHGRFDARAASRSIALSLRINRSMSLLALLLLLVALGFAVFR